MTFYFTGATLPNCRGEEMKVHYNRRKELPPVNLWHQNIYQKVYHLIIS
jgi:hypothetical protein